MKIKPIVIIMLIFSISVTSCDVAKNINGVKDDEVLKKSKIMEGKSIENNPEDIITGELGKIKRLYIADNKILFDNIGLKDVSDLVECMKKEDGKWINCDWKQALHIGMTEVEIIEKDGAISKIKIHKEPDYSYIRVALSKDVNQSGDDNINFQNLSLSSKDGFFIDSPEGMKYIEDESINVSCENGMIYLDAMGEKASYKEEVRISPRLLYITIPGLTRGGSDSVIPKYYGLIEICNVSSNMFNVINEVPIENYIKGVVPSEIGYNSHEEALKVQSILSRTFAYREYASNKYSSKGYWVEDSIRSQVYNNKSYNDNVEKAVEDTKGLVIKNTLDELEFVYFYSTSSGFSSTPPQVWYRGGELIEDASMPCQSFLYDEGGTNKIELTDLNEERLAAIYKNLKLNSHDSKAPFFRWKVSFNKDELKNTIESNLAYLHDRSPDLVLYKNSEGQWEVRNDVDYSIGEILDIKVEKRGNGGNIIELSIKGKEDEVKVIGEYYIRNLLRPSKAYTKGEDVYLYMAKGGASDYMEDLTRVNYSLLPSTFITFDIEREDDVLDSITIYGGGNGHGAGISQNGIKFLAEAGQKYEDIINTYITNVKIENIMND